MKQNVQQPRKPEAQQNNTTPPPPPRPSSIFPSSLRRLSVSYTTGSVHQSIPMNTSSSFMDKQIMDPTQSFSQCKDLINQNHHFKQKEDHHLPEEPVAGDKETLNRILPSYDFQPIRPHSTVSALSRHWNSDSNAGSSHPPPNSIIKSYSSLDTIETAKVVEKERKAFEATILSEIDQIMKKHTENLLHFIEGVSARLTRLESINHRLENSVDDFKVSVGNNLGSTDGKLRQLENILHEVQSGVQTIKDKQDILGAQLQLAKLQVSKMDQPSETQTSVNADPVQQAAFAPQQSQQQLPSPINILQSIPVVPPPNAPPQLHPQQGLPLPVQIPNQFPQNQIPVAPHRDPYFPPPPQPVQSQEAQNEQYQLPLSQQPNPHSGAPPHQQYQQTSHPQYSQPAPHLPQQQPPHSAVNLPQLQSSLGHHIEETPYAPSQNYPPNLCQPTSQPPSGPPPSQQYYSAPPHAYEPPSSRPGSGYSSGYGTLSGPIEPYRYGGSSQYDGPSTPKPPQPQLPTASSLTPSGGSGYTQLPTARVLPQALPTASAASGGSGSAGTGSRVPIDDVVDKVACMGFSRDQVRATVRKLTENGQAVDLNTVLDKLMNERDVQPSRGWFGAR